MERYKEYLRSKKELVNQTVSKLNALNKDEIRHLQWRLKHDFIDVVSLFIDPNIDRRREQLADIGFQYEEIERIDLNGSQMGCAINVCDWLIISPDKERRDVVSKLSERLDEMME